MIRIVETAVNPTQSSVCQGVAIDSGPAVDSEADHWLGSDKTIAKLSLTVRHYHLIYVPPMLQFYVCLSGTSGPKQHFFFTTESVVQWFV